MHSNKPSIKIKIYKIMYNLYNRNIFMFMHLMKITWRNRFKNDFGNPFRLPPSFIGF